MAIAPPPPSKVQVSQTGAEPQSGGRVTRMAALTGNTSESPSSGNGTAAAGGRRYGDSSESDGYGDTPGSARGGHPVTGKRHGSLSSQSMLGALDDHSSPNSGSGGQYSSPEGVASGQSEQLPSFKDYYSHDDIHPGDAVATLWAYQPRAGDEFELERGDMLKIVGLWDDGWATGVRLNERAETYIAARRIQRDSGMSQGPGRRGESASPTGMIKAFPVSGPAFYALRFAWLLNVNSWCASVCRTIGRRLWKAMDLKSLDLQVEVPSRVLVHPHIDGSTISGGVLGCSRSGKEVGIFINYGGSPWLLVACLLLAFLSKS